jgi:hypothetical protein
MNSQKSSATHSLDDPTVIRRRVSASESPGDGRGDSGLRAEHGAAARVEKLCVHCIGSEVVA